MKPTTKGMKHKLDLLISELGKLGHCWFCGYRRPTEAVHIFRRGHMSTRWDWGTNVQAGCRKCHQLDHGEPEESKEFTSVVKENMGPLQYELLRQKSVQVKQWKLWELQEKAVELTVLLAERGKDAKGADKQQVV